MLAAAALVLALAGCASSTTDIGHDSSSGAPSVTPTASTAAVSDLIGTVWSLAGAADTTVRFHLTGVTVASGDASSTYAWTVQGAQILVGGSTSSLERPVAAPWLTAAARIERTAEGLTLVAADGATTARLTDERPGVAETPATPLGVATPGAGVTNAPSSALDGRWILPSDLRTTVTFTDGAWRATSSCTSGTVGGTGVYRVLSGGLLLVTRTTTPIRGCPITDGPRTAGPNAITAIARAASFKVVGDTLTLFDPAGTTLGSLTRG